MLCQQLFLNFKDNKIVIISITALLIDVIKIKVIAMKLKSCNIFYIFVIQFDFVKS